MIHNQTASVVSLARTVLQGVDSHAVETKVSTATLKLLLETLIELGAPAYQAQAAEPRTVASQMNGLRNGR